MSKSTVLNRFEQAVDNNNKFILGGSVETEGGQNLKKIYLTVDMTDISTASTSYISSPVAGTISKISTIINGVITTGDAIITSKIAAVNITNGAITIANAGSAAGDVDSTIPTALNIVAVGDNINFTTDGGSTNTVRATIIVEITLS